MKMFVRYGVLLLTASAFACGGKPGERHVAADTGQAGGSPAATMTAVRINEHGDPDVMRLEQVPRPAAGPGELLVRVHAAAVNPVDTQIRAGPTGFARLPYTPGFDVSGFVVEAGNVRTAAILVRPDADQLAHIASLVDAGDLRPIVSHRLSLDRVAEAHRQRETGSTRGKIVLELLP